MVKTRTAFYSAIIAAVVLICAIAAYFAGNALFNSYFESWGDRLVALEKAGLLSREFGAAWQDILDQDKMRNQATAIAEKPVHANEPGKIVNGIHLGDYPSLSIVHRLNELNVYSNTIEIADRKGRSIALIRTDHSRARLEEFPRTLVTALVAAEDEHFWTRPLGFEYKSYIRAIVMAVWRSCLSFHPVSPQGTSTITQQVAKLFVSSLDKEGKRQVGHTIDRKLREMRLAAALRKACSPQEIIEVYLNHCVTSDWGLVGYRDIAIGLFGKNLSALSDAEWAERF
jgi:membrane peptidoglycan carboxypeptidase